MKILALEFSSPQRSAAVLRREDLHEPPTYSNESGVHTIRLANLFINGVIESGTGSPLTMIDEALREAKLEREQIECIAVGLGPGSYTGIRAAISIAQGWQLARGIDLLGVSSAESIAAQAYADGATGRVNVIVDAQRDEFYLGGYELAPDGLREVEPLKIVSVDEVRRHAEAGELLIGPEVSRWFPTGKIVFPRAATIGKLALEQNDFIPGEKLEPIYLRETKFVKAPPPRRIG
ncbi:MAG TPA: tRNA (adenosine(37)-N6)-threonylcarbamoyltransferase complex dimerization subunit type 1 TsaB [Candidatus Angelobacter sp.]|nr:tRNA (adenosine(37)-N6)-threonylcarbamoyltransferase complex dimerization subunit type 1 TsaB [Candidatus Angelobacter sp.]